MITGEAEVGLSSLRGEFFYFHVYHFSKPITARHRPPPAQRNEGEVRATRMLLQK